MRNAVLIAQVAALVTPVSCLSAPVSPTFEVASIKQSPSGNRSGTGCSNDPGRINCTNMSLANLVLTAYGVQHYQLFGIGLGEGDRFDVAAKVPEGATKEEIGLMWQNLLRDRFKLAVHRENKEVTVYQLVVAKGGLKIQESVDAPPSTDPVPPPPTGPNPRVTLGTDGFPDLPPRSSMAIVDGRARWRASRLTMEQITSRLSVYLGQPITDGTGLKGKYDFTLSWIAQSPNGKGAAASQTEGGSPLAGFGDNDTGPTLFTAVQNQLGLKLEQKRGSMEILVLDYAEKVPTEN